MAWTDATLITSQVDRTHYDDAPLMIPGMHAMNPDDKVHDASTEGENAFLRSYVEGSSYAASYLLGEIPVATYDRNASAYYSFYYRVPGDWFDAPGMQHSFTAECRVKGKIVLGCMEALTPSHFVDFEEHARARIFWSLHAAREGADPGYDVLFEGSSETLFEEEAPLNEELQMDIDRIVTYTRSAETGGQDDGDLHLVIQIGMRLETKSDLNWVAFGGYDEDVPFPRGPVSGSLSVELLSVGVWKPWVLQQVDLYYARDFRFPYPPWR